MFKLNNCFIIRFCLKAYVKGKTINMATQKQIIKLKLKE